MSRISIHPADSLIPSHPFIVIVHDPLSHSFLRARAVFEEEEDASAKSYFSEIIASVSDIEFTKDGKYIVARDYLQIKVWDCRMERRPVRIVPVHEYLRPKLSELYESDCIFDKFRVAASGQGRQVLTGSYNNCFKIYDCEKGTETMVELSKSRPKPPVVRRINGGVGIGVIREQAGAGGAGSGGGSSNYDSRYNDSMMDGDGGGAGNGNDNNGGSVVIEDTALRLTITPSPASPLQLPAAPPINPEELDFSKKVLHYSWHPNEDIVAVAGLNNLYIYHA